MNSVCRGYQESTPNSLHKDNCRRNETIQLVDSYPQYPQSLLLLLLLRLFIFHTPKIKRRSQSYTYRTIMCSDERIFLTRSSYVSVGNGPPTAILSAVTADPFTGEGTIDDACSRNTTSISTSLARKSEGGIRSGCCRRRYSVIPRNTASLYISQNTRLLSTM